MTLAPLIAAIDLDARMTELLRRWAAGTTGETCAAEEQAAAIDAAEEARVDAERLAEIDREEAQLRDEIEAGDRDASGRFIPWPRYP